MEIDNSKDYYQILEISPKASEEVIYAAYKVLMEKYDPEKDGEYADEDIARLVKEAYEVLSGYSSRQSYDAAKLEISELKTIGNYRITGLLAEGETSNIYKAEHIVLREPACIKHCTRISSQHSQLFLAEARAIWDLRHIGIPSVRDLLKLEDGSIAMVMSYLPGLTLEQIIQKVGALEPTHIAWITERTLNTLLYLHYNGVVHGDIQPKKIIVNQETHTAAIVGFGLSAIKPKGKEEYKGHTPYFASPEQMDKKTILPESDLYSLGMTMIYALSGDLEMVKRVEVPEDCPEPLCEFIRKLIVRDVIERPHWEKEDLFALFQEVRQECFGTKRSGFKPIAGL